MRFLTAAVITLLTSSSVLAADIGGITVNGEIAFDYTTNSTGGNPTVVPGGTEIPFSGAAQDNTYRVNTTQILAKKETEKVSVLARLVFNPISYESAPATTSKNNFGVLDQIEVYYKPLPNLYIGAGRFMTTMGYESVLRSENIFYGYSIGFQGITPGYGEGLRAKYIVNDLFTTTLSTYNQSNYNVYGDDYTPTKTTELSVNGTMGDLQWFAAYYFGKDAGNSAADRVQNAAGNVWASYRFSENLMAAITYDSKSYSTDLGTSGWSDSTIGLISYKLWNNTLSARYEMIRGAAHMSEGGLAVYNGADKVHSLTLADKINLNENLNAYVEFRADEADEQAFKDSDNAPTKYAHMLTLGVLASF
ncbi:outer membrane beta-barrel protein [Bdellovibrio sp. HCB290]|uniref:outer membrane beta-barrel protein n=1 Tax=Bdellovibrio sp. HCB290 TaxID=3394356 RepID=UPI0039B40B93